MTNLSGNNEVGMWKTHVRIILKVIKRRHLIFLFHLREDQQLICLQNSVKDENRCAGLGITPFSAFPGLVYVIINGIVVRRCLVTGDAHSC